MVGLISNKGQVIFPQGHADILKVKNLSELGKFFVANMHAQLGRIEDMYFKGGGGVKKNHFHMGEWAEQVLDGAKQLS